MEPETGLAQLVSQLQNTVQEQQAELNSLKFGPVTASSQGPTSTQSQPLLWKSCPSLECGVVRPHLLTLGNHVYVGGGNANNLDMSRRVHKYIPGADKWESLPITPYQMFALTSVKGYITLIGGVNMVTSMTSGDLLHFDGDAKKWKKNFPAMPTKRCAASAASTLDYTVAIGGIDEDGRSYLDTVEVLNIASLQWMQAAPLPKPTSFMCITTCMLTNRIYLLGGLTKQGSINSIFSCILTELVHSAVESADKAEGTVWEDLTQTPFHRMGCVAVGGKLVVASGLNDDDKVTKSVHAFDPVTRQWTVVGEMAASRSSCSLASLSDNHLMVVGGYTNPRNWLTSLTTDVMECVNLRL